MGPLSLPRARRVLLFAGWLGVAAFTVQAATHVAGAGADRLLAPGLYDAVCVVALLVCATRVLPGGRDRLAWLCLTIALLCWLGGDAYWYAVVVDLAAVPYPSPSDGIYLGFYPACYVAVMLLVRARAPDLPRAAWLDGVIGAAVAAALVTAVVFKPVLGALEGDAAAVATSIAYPAADVLLLAVVAGALGVLGRRPDRTLALLAVALAVNTVTDCVSLMQAAKGTYVDGGLLDAGWMVVALVIATAAARTASAAPSPPAVRAKSPEILIGAFATVAVALLVYDAAGELAPAAEFLLSGAVAAILLRLVLAVREVRGLEHNRVEARTDELTALANRREFYASVENHLEGLGGAPVSLLLIDLDDFKEFNDTLGHAIGDELLREFADRLTLVLPGAATVARLGGDEFIALLPGFGISEAVVAARRVQDALERPFCLDGITTPVGASAGIAVSPDHGRDRAELMRNADIAMYRAKASGAFFEVFSEHDSAISRERLILAGELQDAIEAGQLVLHYQPKVDVSSGAVAGVEALVRWQHPERGLLMPDTFLPVAERNGLMGRLTLRVLDMALAQQREWRKMGVDLQVAVNLAAADLLNARFAATVAERLERWDAQPSALMLEITEDIVMTEHHRALDVLAGLSEIGIALALDDYGTGHSSLAQLKRLPVEELKIDRSFVCNLVTDPQDAVIVRSTVELARNLGLRVVAEGVESAAAVDLLADYGCDLAQGYHLSRPLPATAATEWLASHSAHIKTAAPPTRV